MILERLSTIIAFPAFEPDSNNRRMRPPANVMPMATGVHEQGLSDVLVIDGESLGLSPEILANEITKWRPNIVGLSVLTPALYQAQATAAQVRALRPESTVVFGGKHPTHCHADVLADPNVDFVVVGEGEEPLQRIVQAKSRYSTAGGMQQALDQEPGIAFRGKKGVVTLAHRTDFKNLPTINWDLLHPSLPFYQGANDNFLVEGARGCFGQCTFCLAARYRKGMSFKPADTFVTELQRLNGQGFSSFFMTDDDAMANFAHANAVWEGIIDARMRAQFEVNARADSILKCINKNSDFLRLAKRAGLRVIHLGIESGSPDILRYCKKGIQLEDVRKVVRMATAVGLTVETNFIIGLPPDTEETVEKSIVFAEQLRNDGPHVPHVSIFMPYPGTEAYDDAVASGLLDPRELDLSRLHVHRGAVIPTRHLPPQRVNELYTSFYERLYSPEYLEYLRVNHPEIYTIAQGIAQSKSLPTDIN